MVDFDKTKNVDEVQWLRQENARLKALLSQHNIPWEEIPAEKVEKSTEPDTQLSIAEKLQVFRRLFQGRSDVYPLRWESSSGKSGYSPACGNEWKAGICNKPQIKCGDCNQRLLLPVTDQVIYDHLIGKHTIGVYPLLTDDRCYFLAVDFDESSWKKDTRAFIQACQELEIPASLEISRSGMGAHIWIFFDCPVPARDARLLGAALISYTCDQTRQLSLSSYDRFFPNQDTLPKGGFGNLIALPLQKQPREQGYSVFVDEHFVPYADQWKFLASIHRISRTELEQAIIRAAGGKHPLDIAFVTQEEENKPWQHPTPVTDQIPGALPQSLNLILANQIFIAKADLPQPLANRLIRLAAFQNPEFYKAQAMRLPVWNKPRIIGCAENFAQHIGLPRGCLDSVLELLKLNNIQVNIQDEQVIGCQMPMKFTGSLRKEQKTALNVMTEKEIGILNAPTAFGKTITAIAIMAKRKVSTLILVHRAELLRQWKERLAAFLDIPTGKPGMIGGGQYKPTGQVDIAIIQSLSRRKDLSEILDNYGQIIVDECHHLSAYSFENVLKQAKSKYILGLTATPDRRDGHHPIIFMQCGSIRYSASCSETTLMSQKVIPRMISVPSIMPGMSIQEVFRLLITNAERNQHIVQDILTAYQNSRKLLVLTERTEHLIFLQQALKGKIKDCFVLHGQLSKKQRADTIADLNQLPASTPHVLLATGRLIGEGFDHPPLDTLVLAMPISWKGTLQQYAGRLHRKYAGKQDVRIYDYVEQNCPQLVRMWEKRQRGYRAMGYQLQEMERNYTSQRNIGLL